MTIKESEILKEDLVVFCITNCSSNTDNITLKKVNNALNLIIDRLKETANDNPYCNVYLSLSKKSFSGVYFDKNDINHLENYKINVDEVGIAEVLDAFYSEITEHDKNFKNKQYYYIPIIIFLDISENDENISDIILRIKENTLFKRSMKLAYSTGNINNTKLLSDLTGNPEAVLVDEEVLNIGNYIVVCDFHQDVWIDKEENNIEYIQSASMSSEVEDIFSNDDIWD